MTDRARLLERLAPLALLAVLGAAWAVPAPGWARLAMPGSEAAAGMVAALDELPSEPIVLVGFDPDLGTYPEIRPTVRALLADLLARDGRLVLVSLTPEGRALATAELARLDRGEANAARLLDLGFVAGAEAGLVDLARGVDPRGRGGILGRAVADEGFGAVSAVLVVGGNDLGPRSWVEQVAPRVEAVPFLAITPAVLLPEVQPYVGGGQLRAVLATPRDGAAYRDGLDLGRLERLAEPEEPRTLPVLLGLLVALAVLGKALGDRLLAAARESAPREAE